MVRLEQGEVVMCAGTHCTCPCLHAAMGQLPAFAWHLPVACPEQAWHGHGVTSSSLPNHPYMVVNLLVVVIVGDGDGGSNLNNLLY